MNNTIPTNTTSPAVSMSTTTIPTPSTISVTAPKPRSTAMTANDVYQSRASQQQICIQRQGMRDTAKQASPSTISTVSPTTTAPISTGFIIPIITLPSITTPVIFIASFIFAFTNTVSTTAPLPSIPAHFYFSSQQPQPSHQSQVQ